MVPNGFLQLIDGSLIEFVLWIEAILKKGLRVGLPLFKQVILVGAILYGCPGGMVAPVSDGSETALVLSLDIFPK